MTFRLERAPMLAYTTADVAEAVCINYPGTHGFVCHTLPLDEILTDCFFFGDIESLRVAVAAFVAECKHESMLLVFRVGNYARTLRFIVVPERDFMAMIAHVKDDSTLGDQIASDAFNAACGAEFVKPPPMSLKQRATWRRSLARNPIQRINPPVPLTAAIISGI